MAIYHFSVKTLSRATGRSATAAAAYRAACIIQDERTGQVFDYTRKGGIVLTEIVTPHGMQAPAWATDRERLWNEAEKAETRINSRVAREAEIALPHDLPATEREALTRELAQLIADRYNVPVDYSIHEPARNGDDRNHHAHILFATREIGPDGFGKKTRVLDAHETGPDEIDRLRQDWADLINRALERAGIPERVDPRTLEAQGIDREPTQHLGPDATALERRNERTTLGDFNRAAAHNPLVREDRADQPKPSGDLSRKERRDLVATLYRQSDGPEAFRQALSQSGFDLAIGDRRPFVVTDSKGATYNLARLVPEATNDSLREYFTPIMDQLRPAREALSHNRQDPSLTEAFNQAVPRAATDKAPDLTQAFNRQTPPPVLHPSPDEAAHLDAIARMTAEFQALLQKQAQTAEQLEAQWEAKIQKKREELAARQDARRQQEDEDRQPKGMAVLWERVRDIIDPDRLETRAQEAARIDAARHQREASERLALDTKLEEALAANRQRLETRQHNERRDLEHHHDEEIARILQEDATKRRILEDFHRRRQARSRDLTRDDTERERGRDR